MENILKHSLLLRIGMAMATITGLAFVGMLSSVYIAELTQGAAAAVNQAGTLRMQSYRIAANLNRSSASEPDTFWQNTIDLVDEFDYRLNNPRLVRAIPHDGDGTLRYTYDTIANKWQNKIRPLLSNAAERALSGKASQDEVVLRHSIRDQYLGLVESFVEQIDHLVTLLENEAETNIQLLRLIQIITLFLTLGVVIATMYLMHTDVLLPLRELLNSARHASKGDFSFRTSYTGNDELGDLGRAFNTMAEYLSKIYADLEHRVAIKTADLERSNRSLELLYNTTKRLTNNPLNENTFKALLADIENLTAIGPGSLCLASDDNFPALRIGSTRHPKPDLPDICSSPECRICFGDGSTRIFDFPQDDHRSLKMLSCPIRDQDEQYGILLIEIVQPQRLDEWQTRLVETVAAHIGRAISGKHQAAQSHRLALFEERSVIARELHDSLAQSLSYLKIQASRISISLDQGADKETIAGVIQELREGTNSAYRQLRELLTTFRLQIDGRGLGIALLDSVEKTHQQSQIDIHLDDHLPAGLLNANEEIHVLQIVREGLSNIVRHAQASSVNVILVQDEEARVRVIIEDDGKGLKEITQRKFHYGLAIMEERASSLGGKIQWVDSPTGGTRVELTFSPTVQSADLAMTKAMLAEEKL